MICPSCGEESHPTKNEQCPYCGWYFDVEDEDNKEDET